MPLPEATILTKSSTARNAIWIFSIVIFLAVVALGNFKMNIHVGFDVHIFAAMNAVLNGITAVLLVLALIAVKTRHYFLHKRLMVTALSLSVIFLLSYVAHHLLASEARFGDANHDGIVSPDELAAVGSLRTVYFIILSTHIVLAAVILPFILFTAYRALAAEFPAHVRLARITWPIWFYVAVTGPIIYWMISPYYR